MFNIYRRLWQINWAEQWQYRANLAMYLLYWIVSPIVYLAVWTTIAGAQGSVGGLSANDFVTYYMTLLLVDNLTSQITIHLLAYKIQDGTLSGELLKPVHPILTNTLVNNLAFKALNFLVLLPIWFGLFLLVRPDYSGVTWQNLLLVVPAIVIGFLVSFLLGATITCVAFWTTRVYALDEFYNAVAMLFSGQFVPLTLLPGAVQQVAQFLPFQVAIYFPVQLILGKLSPESIQLGFGVGIFWLVVSYGLFHFVWTRGVKQFSAVGA